MQKPARELKIHSNKPTNQVATTV